MKANVIGWSFQAVVRLFFSSVFTFVGLYNGLRFWGLYNSLWSILLSQDPVIIQTELMSRLCDLGGMGEWNSE